MYESSVNNQNNDHLESFYNNDKPTSYSEEICCDSRAKKTFLKLSEFCFKFGIFWLTLGPIIAGAVGAIRTVDSIFITSVITIGFVIRNDHKNSMKLKKSNSSHIA